MRTLLKLILLFLAVAYLIFATVTFLWRKDDTPCRTVSIVIADSAQATLITRDAVENATQIGALPRGAKHERHQFAGFGTANQEKSLH